MAAIQPSIEDLLVGVYNDQKSRLWGYFIRGAENEQIAEDLLQEIFLRLWDHRGRLATELPPGDRESMRRYMWRTARNLMIDEIRAMQKERAVSPSMDSVSADHHAAVEREDCLRVVRESVGRLKSKRARRCMRLWLDGKELTQIAEEGRLGIGQVRGLIQRARAEVILRAGNLLRTAAER
jgi:RNA polymerase sigma-70 factor (ECF subfamily)